MIDHFPWPNEQPTDGFNGQRIAIVMYSHHRKIEEPDKNEWTWEIINTVLEDENRGSVRFIRALPKYFGCSPTDPIFWNQVTFFNFLPDCVISNDRYTDGTPEQIERGRDRLRRVLRNIGADKVLIFFSKPHLPKTLEQQQGQSNIQLGPEFPNFWRGTYDVGGGQLVQVFKLRHPQGARNDTMQLAVKRIMDDTFASAPRATANVALTAPTPATPASDVLPPSDIKVKPCGPQKNWFVTRGLPTTMPQPLTGLDGRNPGQIHPHRIGRSLDILIKQLKEAGTPWMPSDGTVVRDYGDKVLLVREGGSWVWVKSGTELYNSQARYP
jgi:hypothetical protein